MSEKHACNNLSSYATGSAINFPQQQYSKHTRHNNKLGVSFVIRYVIRLDGARAHVKWYSGVSVILLTWGSNKYRYILIELLRQITGGVCG